MRTVHEVSELTGVSIRTLQYYDKVGLLRPAARSDAGYRLYDEGDLARLQQILLFRELEFSLKDIRGIIESPRFDRTQALQQQIKLLELKRDHIDGLIELAREMLSMGKKANGFEAFDTSKLDEYAAQAKASWGTTPEWKEYEQKSKGRTRDQEQALAKGMMEIFAEFGAIRDQDPASEAAQALVNKLQSYISEHFYTCSNEILLSLSKMYGGGGSMTENIDKVGGPGTGEFSARAIAIHCKA